MAQSAFWRLAKQAPRWFLRGKKVILLNGFRRSGNHALAYWLIGAIEGRPVPTRLERQHGVRIAPSGTVVFLNNLNFTPGPEYVIQLWRARKTIRRATWIIASLEDCGAEDVETHAWRAGRPDHRVLVRRSALNLVASRIAHMKFALEQGHNGKSMPCNRGFFRKLFSVDRLEQDGWISWQYDRWLTSANYRRMFLDQLGLEGAPDLIPGQTREGGGSSFTGRRDSDAPPAEKLLNRYEMVQWIPAVVRFALEPEFRGCLTEQEVLFLEMQASVLQVD